MLNKGLLLISIFALGAVSAEAKVFTPGAATFGAYMRGTGGTQFTNTLMSKSSGDNLIADTDHDYLFSGEFGFVWGAPNVTVRFGIEIIRPPQIKDRDVKNASGSVYNFTSEISAIAPKVDFEITLKKWPASKLYLLAGAGYATLVARNSYAFTTGRTAYGTMADFSEDLRSVAPMYEGAIGFEGVMTDSNTYFIEAGYRGLAFEDIRHNQGTTTFQGPVSKDDKAKNMDGSTRSIDLSNGYATIGLRFWIR